MRSPLRGKLEKGGEIMTSQKELTWEMPRLMKLSANGAVWGNPGVSCNPSGASADACLSGVQGGCTCAPTGSAASTCDTGNVAT
jgi:hypothetical protein